MLKKGLRYYHPSVKIRKEVFSAMIHEQDNAYTQHSGELFRSIIHDRHTRDQHTIHHTDAGM